MKKLLCEYSRGVFIILNFQGSRGDDCPPSKYGPGLVMYEVLYPYCLIPSFPLPPIIQESLAYSCTVFSPSRVWVVGGDF